MEQKIVGYCVYKVVAMSQEYRYTVYDVRESRCGGIQWNAWKKEQ